MGLGLRSALLLPFLTWMMGKFVYPMVETLPWPAITAASGGWVLFGLAMAGVIMGKGLGTQREIRYLERQIEKKDDLIQAFATSATGHAIPALTRSAEVLERMPESGGRIYTELRRLEDEISNLSEQFADAAKDGSE